MSTLTITFLVALFILLIVMLIQTLEADHRIIIKRINNKCISLHDERHERIAIIFKDGEIVYFTNNWYYRMRIRDIRDNFNYHINNTKE